MIFQNGSISFEHYRHWKIWSRNRSKESLNDTFHISDYNFFYWMEEVTLPVIAMQNIIIGVMCFIFV